jgi:HAD superfamily hydrolase (TIGR01509 family)
VTVTSVAPLEVAAITIDFGNTLVRVDRPNLTAVVHETARVAAERGLAGDEATFLRAWDEERARQFREDLPRQREVDIRERVIRIIARQRGMAAPPEASAWDDAAAARLVEPSEVEAVVDAYSWAFVDRMPPVGDADAVLEQLSEAGFTLGVLSNWPLAETIERYCEVRGWTRHLRTIVVSQRVGAIKPQRAIFDHARERLGAPADRILHVGDDWAADVVGAREAGWHTAYVRDRQVDTPLPTSAPPDDAALAAGGATSGADLVIAELADLPPLVRRWAGPTR